MARPREKGLDVVRGVTEGQRSRREVRGLVEIEYGTPARDETPVPKDGPTTRAVAEGSRETVGGRTRDH